MGKRVNKVAMRRYNLYSPWWNAQAFGFHLPPLIFYTLCCVSYESSLRVIELTFQVHSVFVLVESNIIDVHGVYIRLSAIRCGSADVLHQTPLRFSYEKLRNEETVHVIHMRVVAPRELEARIERLPTIASEALASETEPSVK